MCAHAHAHACLRARGRKSASECVFVCCKHAHVQVFAGLRLLGWPSTCHRGCSACRAAGHEAEGVHRACISSQPAISASSLHRHLARTSLRVSRPKCRSGAQCSQKVLLSPMNDFFQTLKGQRNKTLRSPSCYNVEREREREGERERGRERSLPTSGKKTFKRCYYSIRMSSRSCGILRECLDTLHRRWREVGMYFKSLP